MELNGWNRISMASVETARVVHVLANLGYPLHGAPAKRERPNLNARAEDVQMNWSHRTEYSRPHVGRAWAHAGRAWGARMTVIEWDCE